MRITICIATYDRQEGLRSALQGVSRLDLPPRLREAVSVLVVDNNPDGRARAVADEVRTWFPLPLGYVHEQKSGISRARNAALDNTEGSDFVAFLDDDEIPEPAWLTTLLATQAAFDADVVSGPTLPRFDRPPSPWLVAGHFWDPARHPDGALVDTAYSGNVLFRRATVMRHAIRFDEAIGHIGGEDVDFFDRLRRAGATLRYSDNAIAFETIPPHRTTLRWLIRRWFRTGNSEAILYMDRHAGPLARLIVVGKGATRLLLGLAALAVVALVAGTWRRHWTVARLYTIARGLGMISSAFNLHYYEYAR